MATQCRILIYGGKGALGSACVKYFKKQNFWVGSIDLSPNEDADANIVVKPADTWLAQEEDVNKSVESVLGDNKVDAILCVAGGWAGGNAASKDFVKNSDLMWKQSVWTSVISAGLAAKHMKDGGVLSLPGAAPAVSGTPGMIGYGLAKAAIHQLVKSLAGKNSGLPQNTFVAATLPVTLDTPMNRKFMANADFSTWTPLEYIAEMFHKWMNGQDRPASGSLVKIVTKDNKTEILTV